MKRGRLLRYHFQRFLLGTNPEGFFLMGAVILMVGGLAIPSLAIMRIIGGFLIFVYGFAFALWWRSKFA